MTKNNSTRNQRNKHGGTLIALRLNITLSVAKITPKPVKSNAMYSWDHVWSRFYLSGVYFVFRSLLLVFSMLLYQY